jgi:hypothetical protein
MKVLITEEQYENLINEMGRQGGAHSYKEYLKFIKWAEEFLNIRVVERGNSHIICPPIELSTECRSTHPHDRAIYDIMRFFAKVYGVGKPEIEKAYKEGRNIKNK